MQNHLIMLLTIKYSTIKKALYVTLILCVLSGFIVNAKYDESNGYYQKEYAHYLNEVTPSEFKTNRVHVGFYNYDDYLQYDSILENILFEMNYDIVSIGTIVYYVTLSFDSLEDAELAAEKLYLNSNIGYAEIVTSQWTEGYPKMLHNTLMDNIALRFPYVIKPAQIFKVNSYIEKYNSLNEKLFSLFYVKELSENLIQVSEQTFKSMYSGNSNVLVYEAIDELNLELEFVVDNVDLNSSFNDISDYKRKNSIERVAENGLMTGKSDGLFAPDDKLSIEEFMTIWSRLNYDIEPRLRRDLNIELITSEWSKNYVKNVLNRMTPEQVEAVFGNSLDATKPITGELVSYLLALENDNVVNESDFKFEDNITRAEIAVLLDRMI